MSSEHEEYTLEELEEAKLTAYALGELDELERADVEALLLRSETARRFVQETSLWADRVREAYRESPAPQPSPTLREAVEKELHEKSKSQPGSRTMSASETEKPTRRKLFLGLGITGAAVILIGLSIPAFQSAQESKRIAHEKSAPDCAKSAPMPVQLPEEKLSESKLGKDEKIAQFVDEYNRLIDEQRYSEAEVTAKRASQMFPEERVARQMVVMSKLVYRNKGGDTSENAFHNEMHNVNVATAPADSSKPYEMPDAKTWEKLSRQRANLAKTDASSKAGTEIQAGKNAGEKPQAPRKPGEAPDINSLTRRIKSRQSSDVSAESRTEQTLGLLPKVEFPQYVPLPSGALGEKPADKEPCSTVCKPDDYFDDREPIAYPDAEYWRKVAQKSPNTEQYDPIQENDFLPVVKEPLSTFSIDVDTASYANVRRFLREGRLPPPSAVRIEELVNYFSYSYAPPTDGTPFAVNMETAACPWKSEHRLLRVALKGREIDRKNRGACNLVFLLDVSGSMNEADKLPLVKDAMKMLVEQLTEDDRVAIVTYASDTRVVLPSARGNERERIKGTIDALQAGGCTYGSGGIQLAYQQAVEHFVAGGVNRVILCTDGDLNVGVTRDEELVEMIQEKAKSGVFLTVLGFGSGNLKDSKMQKLADRGNGIYAYVDCLREARKVLVEQMTGSLMTIAKDVKIQIEFNPAVVQAYRLIGYEKRKLANQDFNDDKKDAGEIGAGHAVTALYELVPTGTRDSIPGAEGGLKYQRPIEEKPAAPTGSDELLTLKIRYKEPEKSESKLLEFTTKDTGKKFAEATPDYRFAASVAAFGMTLRSSPYRGNVNFAAVAEFAAGTTENDPNGYRTEYLDLLRTAEKLARGSGE